MADCPKCKKHLRMVDWKQFCPHCGCNIVMYDIQERLMQDADKAEVQHYHFQKKIDRMKASFVGSKLAVVRIFTSLLPVVAIVIPWLKGEFKVPFEPFEGFFTLFTLTDMVEKINISSIADLLATPDGRVSVILLAVGLLTMLLGVVLLLVRFGCLTMACSKKGKKMCYTFDITTLALCIVGIVCLLAVPDNPYFAINYIVAPFAFLALLTVNFIVDVAIFKKGIPVKHEPCFVGGIPIEEYFKMVEDGVPQTELRQEMYRRLTEMQLQKEKTLNEEGK